MTCFDGSDGEIQVEAIGGTAPYTYSLNADFSDSNNTGIFAGLSVTGPVQEGEDQYGGIVVCHKTIYANDANGKIGHVDVELKSPVELEWLDVPNDMTVYCDAGQNYATVDLSMIRPSTMANNCVSQKSGIRQDGQYSLNQDGTSKRYKVTLYAENDCPEVAQDSFHITVLPEPTD